MATIDERVAAGQHVREQLLGPASSTTAPAQDPFWSEFSDMMVEWVWGDVWNRPGLDIKQRSLITMSALAALGREHELQIHIGAALRLGHTKETVRELLYHVAFYAGVPTAVIGMRAARAAFAELEGKV